MKSFDFNQHFQKYNRNRFFNSKTYADLLADINIFSISLKTSNKIALKIQSPYFFFVALLASYKENKLAVLISHLESDSMVQKLREQVHFDQILEDNQIEEALRKNACSEPFLSLNNDNAAFVVFSSGTTAAPKGVALSLNNLYYSALGFAEYFNQTENECSLINLPHHHVGGLMILWRAFFTGGSISIDMNTPVDFVSLVPLQLKRMFEDNLKLEILKKIRVLLIGGAPLSQDLKKHAHDHGIKLYETYGMSETSSLLMINGKVLSYREVKLDEEGFFNIRGKTLALGYFQNNQFIPIPSTWFKTNDIGFVDNFGFYHFKQRDDLIFISGGENINPLLVEEIVKDNTDVTDAYLLPIKDELWGEMGILLYDTKTDSDLSENSLKDYLKNKLHPYLLPKFTFKTSINLEGQLKVKRSDLKTKALELYLKNIFSYDFYETKDAPVLIFFHGFMGEKSDLKIISEQFGSHYSRLYIDLPGHGNTKIENFHSGHDFFLKLKQFIQLFANDPTYYGYSMGGRIALHLALNYLTPKLLILESAGVGLESEVEQLQRKSDDQTQFLDITQSTLLEFLNRWYQNPIFNNYNLHPGYKAEMQKKLLHNFNEWKDSLNLFSAGCFPLMTKILEILSLTKFPIHYIYGENDLKYKALAHKLQLIKNISIHPIKDSGHNPHKTQPHETKKILSDILK